MASSPNIEEVCSLLKRESSFFNGIQSAIYALKNLNDFLVSADPKSVEDLMSEFVGSFSEQVTGFLEEDCLLNLSKILQEPRIVDFLARAGQQISEEDEAIIGKLFYSFIDEYADSSANDVVAWLTEEAPACSILSLVSPPSSTGEININSRILYQRVARNHFDCRYWVDSSGMYKIEKLLEILKRRIDQPLGRVLDAWRTMDLVDKLVNRSFQRNRYMLVFDDVCHEDFWNVVKKSLRTSDIRDSIMASLVSDKIVASFDRVRKLGPLPETQSWELFCGIAFQDEPEGQCPTELESLSREIVGKCKGFPLPIVGIAGLLSKREKRVLEWQKVCNSFKLEVKTNVHLNRSLYVSSNDPFHGFPDHLRPCYIYFSNFPQNSVIPNDKLLKLWIAEGFVEGKMGKTLEEVAEEYLNELIDRGLVQPCQGFDRLEQFCTTDVLKPGIRQSDVDGLGFCKNVPKSRRLSIYSDEDIYPEKFDFQIQSLFLFGGDRDLSFIIRLIRKCELSTVLNFEYCSIERLPEELGNLSHLKYLSLKSTKLKELPKSVEKLINLQTLDLRDTLLLELPTAINKLKNLRHLLASFFDDGVNGDPTRGVKVKRGIGSLQNLQTITMVDAHRSGIGIIRELAALHQLRTLGVSGLTVKTVTALCACIEMFSFLKSLNLQARKSNEDLDLHRISSQLPLLQRVVLKGRFHNLPAWIFGLRNLSTLCLSLTRLSEGQQMLLSHLPNLVSLWLCRAYRGKQLYFKEGSFEKLKLLVVREFHGLNALEIEEGALPCLEELRIGSSPHLSEVPSGIQYLKNLKLLVSYDMPREFVVRMQPDGGSDYWKVEHIPSVFFLCRIEGRKYKMFEIGDSELLDQLVGLATNGHQITEPQHEHEFSLCKNNDEEDGDYAAQLSFSRAQSNFKLINFKQLSFSSGTDDFEE